MKEVLHFILYLLLTVFMLGVLIFVHELGHFMTARACHVTVSEFAIGMGKRIGGFTSKKSGILYSFRILPIGGYVAMAGEDGEVDDPNAFSKKNVWQRMLILVAGAGMNVITGFLAMLILTGGMMAAGYNLPSTQIGKFAPGASSYVSGLELGDEIYRVDGTRIHSGYDLSYEIMFQGNKPVDIVVIRDGEKILIPDVRFATQTSDGVTVGMMDFNVTAMERTPWNVMKVTVSRSVSSIKMVFDALGGMITGRFSLSNMSGPIGVTSAVSQVASQPMAGWNILYMFALIAMNLGVMNLLPIPALDGGRLFFRLVEIVRFGKPVNPETEAKVHGFGMTILMIFMVFIACKDLFNLF